MENILKQAQKNYPKNTLFLSATGNVKSAIAVTTLRLSEIIKGDIINEAGGVIFDSETQTWAEICL